MEFCIPQRVYYSNRSHIPAKEIATSLAALEKVVKYSPLVLEQIFPNAQISNIDLYIDKLESGSLLEELLIKFVYGDQKTFDMAISDTREWLGMDELMESNPEIFTVVILAIILTGVLSLSARILGKKDRPAIEANHNVIIQVGADHLGLEKDEFKRLVDTAIPNKEKAKIAKAAADIVKPATLDREASIGFGNNPKLSLSKDTVRAIPRVEDTDEEELFDEDFSELELIIRAIDLDSSKQGWAVSVPDLDIKRVKMVIDQSINRYRLQDVKSFKGSGNIIYKYDNQLKRKAKLLLLTDIH